MSKRQKRPKFQKQAESIQPITPLNTNQKRYINALLSSPQIVVMGPAGTGKSFLSATIAADLYRQHKIHKIILTRPNISSSKSIGFFPGNLNEKMEPWVAPFTSTLQERMGKGMFDIALKRGNIQIVPLETMRGYSFDNAFVILDEAQNTTQKEMKMFLTRTGFDSTVVINGDISQSDIHSTSGLSMCIDMIEKYNLPADIVKFQIDDIVRSDICKMWVECFQKEGV